MKHLSIAFALSFVPLAGCYDETNDDPSMDASGGDGGSNPDASLGDESCLCFATATDFATGTLSIVGPETGLAAAAPASDACGADPIVRVLGEHVVVLNRFGGDQVLLLDATGTLVATFPTGAGSNPQDAAIFADNLIVVTYGDPTETMAARSELQVWPLDDLDATEPAATLPLASEAANGEDGTNVEASAVWSDGDTVAVALQHLASGNGMLTAYTPSAVGTIVLITIDESVPTVTGRFTLPNKNPNTSFITRKDAILIGTAETPFTDADGAGCLLELTLDETTGSSECLVENADLGGFVTSALFDDKAAGLLTVQTGENLGKLVAMAEDGTTSSVIGPNGVFPRALAGCADSPVLLADHASGDVVSFAQSTPGDARHTIDVGSAAFSIACLPRD